MKTINRHRKTILGICSGVLLVVAAALTAWAQTVPVLSITSLGTNQFSITFTNYPPTTWDLQWTPALTNSEDSWTWVRTGTNGQTNFILSLDDLSGSPTAFFRTVLDTNAIPLWEAADPNNPAAGILTVTIDSPTNGAVIQ